MTLIERLRARLTYLRNEADAAYFRDAADALEAAQAMAESLDDMAEKGELFPHERETLTRFKDAIQ